MSAVCAALAVIGGVFIWVIRMVVQDSIHRAVNGFRTEIALHEQRLSVTEIKLKEVEAYAHAVVHERVNSLSGALLDAFKAGQLAK